MIDGALLLGVAAIIAAFGTAVTQIITARSQSRKLDKIEGTTNLIEGHVNSAASAAKERIASLEKEVALAKDLVNTMRETAALLAQAAAISSKKDIPPVEVKVVNEPPIPVVVKKDAK